MSADSKKVRVGIIGCGAVTELYYAPALKKMEELELVSLEILCDPMQESLNRLAKIFPSAETGEKFVGQSADLFILASPPFLHAEQVIATLGSGAAVLCEKPMGINARQCQEMVAAAQRSGRPLAIGLIRRFFPASKLIKQLVSSENLGKVKSFRFSEGATFSWPAKSSSFFDKRQAGGGVLLDLGSHVLDLLIWWFGNPEDVEYEDDAMGGVEVNCLVRLAYANGNNGTVRLSRDCQLENECYLEFERGWVRWKLTDINTIELCFEQESLLFADLVIENQSKGGFIHTAARPMTLGTAFIAQISNVLDSLVEHNRLIVSGEEAAKSIQLIETCYRKRTLIDMPWLAPDESIQARNLGTNVSVC